MIGGRGVEQQRAELVGRGGRVALHLGGGQLTEQFRQAAALDEPEEQDRFFFKYLNSSSLKTFTGKDQGICTRNAQVPCFLAISLFFFKHHTVSYDFNYRQK